MTTINIPREETMARIAAATEAIAASMNADVSDWEAIARIVKSGAGNAAFPVGSQFDTKGDDGTVLIWEVVHHSTVNSKPCMYLQLHDTLPNTMQFDKEEALYFAENGLATGTYSFSLPSGYDETYGGGQTYHFTLTKAVPAGGVLKFAWGYQQQASASLVSSYTAVDGTLVESVGVAVGASGTNLGAADGTSANMNHIQRVRYGSNNWKESAMRQYLNTAAASGWWKSQTKYDTPPNYVNTKGFMALLPKDFLDVIKNITQKTITNNIFEVNDTVNASYETTDKFWLASRFQVFGTTEGADLQEEQFDYYKGATDVDRIKYSPTGAARYWWLRSPNPGAASYVRFVYSSGALGNNLSANYIGNGVAPACVIY